MRRARCAGRDFWARAMDAREVCRGWCIDLNSKRWIGNEAPGDDDDDGGGWWVMRGGGVGGWWCDARGVDDDVCVCVCVCVERREAGARARRTSAVDDTMAFVFRSIITSRRGRYHPSMASDRDRESPQSRPSIPSCLKNIPSRFASRSPRRPPVEPCTKAPSQLQFHPRSA